MPDAVNAFVQANSYLTLHYRIVLTGGAAAGSVFADTFDARPATLQLGAGQWAPGLERVLLGRAVGERFSVELASEDAYGARNPQLLQRVGRAMLAEHAGPDADFAPGDLVEFQAPHGARYSGVFKAWGEASAGEDWALFDFNHPLAGVPLRLEVEILGVL